MDSKKICDYSLLAIGLSFAFLLCSFFLAIAGVIGYMALKGLGLI